MLVTTFRHVHQPENHVHDHNPLEPGGLFVAYCCVLIFDVCVVLDATPNNVISGVFL